MSCDFEMECVERSEQCERYKELVEQIKILKRNNLSVSADNLSLAEKNYEQAHEILELKQALVNDLGKANEIVNKATETIKKMEIDNGILRNRVMTLEALLKEKKDELSRISRSK